MSGNFMFPMCITPQYNRIACLKQSIIIFAEMKNFRGTYVTLDRILCTNIIHMTVKLEIFNENLLFFNWIAWYWLEEIMKALKFYWTLCFMPFLELVGNVCNMDRPKYDSFGPIVDQIGVNNIIVTKFIIIWTYDLWLFEHSGSTVV